MDDPEVGDCGEGTLRILERFEDEVIPVEQVRFDRSDFFDEILWNDGVHGLRVPIGSCSEE